MKLSSFYSRVDTKLAAKSTPKWTSPPPFQLCQDDFGPKETQANSYKCIIFENPKQNMTQVSNIGKFIWLLFSFSSIILGM